MTTPADVTAMNALALLGWLDKEAADPSDVAARGVTTTVEITACRAEDLTLHIDGVPEGTPVTVALLRRIEEGDAR